MATRGGTQFHLGVAPSSRVLATRRNSSRPMSSAEPFGPPPTSPSGRASSPGIPARAARRYNCAASASAKSI